MMSRGASLEVVVVNDYAYIIGGAGKTAILSAQMLAERGVPTTIFSNYGPVPEDLESVPNLTNACLGKELRPLKAPQVLRNAWNEDAADAFRRLLSTKDPARTVIHPHMWWSGLSASVMHTAAEMGFRIVLAARLPPWHA